MMEIGHAALAAAWLRNVSKLDAIYDRAECMIRVPAESRGIHTRMEQGSAHHVRFSMEYACGLFYRNGEGDGERAVAILDRILKLQDRDADSPTFGVWPYYLEEPLGTMSAPDYNWADFQARILLQLMFDLEDRIPEALMVRIREAIAAACECIVSRNIASDYTNISLMGAYVCAASGARLGETRFLEYGRRRQERALDFALGNGGFAEYNSPDYALVAIEEISRGLLHVLDSRFRAAGEALNRLAWKSLAEHYHQPTGQLSPPHSRCYDDLKGDRFKTFIEMGTGFALKLLPETDFMCDTTWPFIGLHCPDAYLPLFKAPDPVRLLVDPFFKAYDPIAEDEIRVHAQKGQFPMTATTFMTKDYTIGTFDHSDLWTQRRPLMAYWVEPTGPAYLRLRCLKDGRDFASAVVRTVQIDGNVAGGVSFATDHGDYHFILDPLKDAAMNAESIVLRFEFGGAAAKASERAIHSEGEYLFPQGTIDIRIKPLFTLLDGSETRTLVGSNKTISYLDIILYEGPSRFFDLKRLRQAACAFLVAMESGKGTGPCIARCVARYTLGMDAAAIELDACGRSVSFDLPLKPESFFSGNPLTGSEKRAEKGGFRYYMV